MRSKSKPHIFPHFSTHSTRTRILWNQISFSKNFPLNKHHRDELKLFSVHKLFGCENQKVYGGDEKSVRAPPILDFCNIKILRRLLAIPKNVSNLEHDSIRTERRHKISWKALPSWKNARRGNFRVSSRHFCYFWVKNEEKLRKIFRRIFKLVEVTSNREFSIFAWFSSTILCGNSVMTHFSQSQDDASFKLRRIVEKIMVSRMEKTQHEKLFFSDERTKFHEG